MNVKRVKSKQKPSVWRAQLRGVAELFQGWGRGLPLGMLLLVGSSAVWYLVWREVGRQVLASDPYRLSEEKVQIPPPPEWIPGDLRADVLRDAQLDGPLSIMDSELCTRIATAFSLNPWVAEVYRVRKYHPARVIVELDYRRPVCMVLVRDTLLPVDKRGVLLPPVQPTLAGGYPRLEGVQTSPVGPAGTRWRDAKVVGGARIAAVLGPVWQQLGLERIVASGPLASGQANPYAASGYDLITRGGTRILWGEPPGAETPEEGSAADKVAWLVTYQEENGTLEGPSGPQELDVRGAEPPQKGPRTAGRVEKAPR